MLSFGSGAGTETVTCSELEVAKSVVAVGTLDGSAEAMLFVDFGFHSLFGAPLCGPLGREPLLLYPEEGLLLDDDLLLEEGRPLEGRTCADGAAWVVSLLVKEVPEFLWLPTGRLIVPAARGLRASSAGTSTGSDVDEQTAATKREEEGGFAKIPAPGTGAGGRSPSEPPFSVGADGEEGFGLSLILLAVVLERGGRDSFALRLTVETFGERLWDEGGWSIMMGPFGWPVGRLGVEVDALASFLGLTDSVGIFPFSAVLSVIAPFSFKDAALLPALSLKNREENLPTRP
jgi:hypothetical protein